MLFSSITFLYYFIPIVLVLYFIAPKRFKNFILLLSSLVFYGWGEPKFLILMLVAIIQGFIFGLLIDKYKKQGKDKVAKVCLVTTIGINLGFLGVFKYLNFFIDQFNALFKSDITFIRLALPIGISFYTFQLLSYAVDVYRGDTEPQKNIINFGAYVSMFPQLIAGPIVRYSDINKEIEDRKLNTSEISAGITRFMIGLSKKVLIANVLGELTAEFKDTNEKSVLFVWVYAVAYMLHIYFDFSGYSDMAIGLGKIMGFHFPENFNYPYISSSVTEFWRRWHMSLGSWFRDYLYIPMGGNRVTKARWMFNILIVWMATGFWHGAAWNFVIWGLMFAVLLAIEKLVLLKYLKKSQVLSRIYTMFFIMLSFIIFDNIELADGLKTIGGLFGVGSLPLVNDTSVYFLRSYLIVILIGVIGATPLPKYLINKLSTKLSEGVNIIKIAEPFVVLAMLVVCTAFLIDGSFNPFLYLRF